MTQPRPIVRLAVAAVAMSLTACIYDSTPPRDICDVRACVAFNMWQSYLGPIVGDTVRVVVWSDSGYDRDVTWSIAGAAEIVPGSAVQKSDPGIGNTLSSVLVRGVSAGAAALTVSHVGPARTATYALTVSDSSVITEIVILSTSLGSSSSPSFPIFTTTVHVGDSLYMAGIPGDKLGRAYPVTPDGWMTSDTTRATMDFRPMQPRGSDVLLRARAPGQVDVIASFAKVRDTIRITVLPP